MIDERLLKKPTEIGVSLTALDIHNKEFNYRIRGYDDDQVNEFLDMIIKDYEAYDKIIKQLQELVKQLMQEALQTKTLQLMYFNVSGTWRLTVSVDQGDRGFTNMYRFIEDHGIFIMFSLFVILSILCLSMYFISRDHAQKKWTSRVALLTGVVAALLFWVGHNGSIIHLPEKVFERFGLRKHIRIHSKRHR
jgi:DivIVA domain-containing protein